MPANFPDVTYHIALYTAEPPLPELPQATGYARANTGWNASMVPVMIDTAPKPAPQPVRKTIWQHLKEP